MSFVNEHISQEDRQRYRINEIDKKLRGKAPARDWTIDRERDIYLRMLDPGILADGPTGRSAWHLYWHGEVIEIDLQIMKTEGEPGGSRHGHKKLISIEIPESIEEKHEEIERDLREALIAYKDGGIFATATEYLLTLET